MTLAIPVLLGENMCDKIIESSYTDELVCLYCGHTQRDSWEYSESGPATCGECEKEFMYTMECTRTFTSKTADCLNGGEHNWGKWGKWRDCLEKQFHQCKDCEKMEWKTI